MPPIDYEKEYDNRSRVPEHPEIFARWTREGAAYRAAALAAELGLKYGPSPRQTIDLFPAKDDDSQNPLALFIHGGWWRSLDPSMFSQLAAGPNARGVTVAVAGYDFCPQVSIATIIEQMRAACLWLWRKQRKRIFVYGHSAGGHLAACMVSQNWQSFASDAPGNLVPAGLRDVRRI
jgi:arylformamidase